MRVSLAQRRQDPESTPRGLARGKPAKLLNPDGARVIIGASVEAAGVVKPIAPGPASMFGPRGACLAAPAGPLFVCDTGHHRLLVWRRAPEEDGAPADFLIGQPDFSREGRNAKGEVGRATLNVPTGVSAAEGVLAIADAWNHRVLIWHGLPDAADRAPDVVVGQADFGHGLANRGADHARADTLNWCYGVAVVGGRLIVADTGNRRVLVWNTIPHASGAPADLVLGQRDFFSRDENAGEGGGPRGMRWPHGVTVAGGALFVADAGDNRVMAWRTWPRANGAPCDFVLGQADAFRLDHNRSAYLPTARSMNMPYGVCAHGTRFIVADTANSRLIGFERDALATGVGATLLAGQPNFEAKGDNRWSAATRDSLCWPYGVAASGDALAIADSGNNRVLLWDVAP
jgi:hypothetical protein